MTAQQSDTPLIAIIGGGISGLAAAYRVNELARGSNKRVRVTVLESSDRLGGVISTLSKDGFIIEKGPDSFITQKPAAMALCKRLGIEGHIIGTNPENRGLFVVNNGRLVPVPEGFLMMAPTNWWSFINSPLFSLSGKLRIAMELLVPKADTLADESLSSFVRRRLGNEALERIAQPLVGGIYTADPEKLSLRATMPRFLEMEQNHGSVIRGLCLEKNQRDSATSKSTGARYSLFASLDEGLQLLVDKLSGELDDIRLNATVSGVAFESSARKWRLKLEKSGTIEADAVIIAAPVWQAARLLRSVDAELSESLSSIKAASSAVLNLVYPRRSIPHKLDAFGFVVPAAEKRSILACTFSSVKFLNRSPAGKVLIRVFLGGALHPEIYELSDEQMVEAARADLRELLAITDQPELNVLSRYPLSMPQYEVGHMELVERIAKRVNDLPGLAVAGNAYSGVGIPDCIRSGEEAAQRILTTIAKE